MPRPVRNQKNQSGRRQSAAGIGSAITAAATKGVTDDTPAIPHGTAPPGIWTKRLSHEASG